MSMSGSLNQLSTAGGAEHIPSVSLDYAVDFHCELWSPDLAHMVEDISDSMSVEDSNISYQADADVRHSAQLRFDERHDWNGNRVKLLCSLTNHKDGEVRTYSLGFYFAEVTSQVLDSLSDPYTVELFDLTTQLDNPIGFSYYIANNSNIGEAIRSLLAAQSQWNRFLPDDANDPITVGYRISPTEAHLVNGRVWRLSEANTWRRVLNRLCDDGGYRSPWLDRDGQLVVEFQYGTAQTVVLPEDHFAVVAEGATLTTDIYRAPNQWIIVGVVAGEAGGGGQPTTIIGYQDLDASAGPHSFEARGRRVVRKVYAVDVGADGTTVTASEESLQRHAARLVGQDKEANERVSFRMSPMPVLWHNDLIALPDYDLDGLWRVQSWRLPLDGGDMNVEAVKVDQ